MKHKRETFQTPYEPANRYNGQHFKVKAQIENEDKETLYKIKLESGEVIEAWPEEVLNNMPNKLHNN